jgi:predicted ATPase
MGLHVGYVERTATGYVGLEVHRAARVAAAAHGGQLLMTGPARALVGDQVATEPLGEHRLKDFPSPELLFCAVVDGRGASFFPPPRTQHVRPTNLPAGLPALVGREVEIGVIRDAFLVEGERMVTVTGRGGTGKTSLALVAATSLLDEHPGGVWLIRLAMVTAPGDVLLAVAEAIGAELSEDESESAVIGRRLSGRGPTLLVLDNLEHLLAAAPEIAGLLAVASELRVLITSQAPLRVASERCLAVDALDTDDALELMERVARRRSASFRVSDDDREALGEIVWMLDGLPLALELAAARLSILAPAQLRDRLRGSSDLLRDDMRDRGDRHRSLRATADWTLGLLDQPAQQLFVRIGAFAGPVELEEIEAVAGADGLDVLHALSNLLEVALVRRVESGDGRIRFGLPEALRQIAASMLDAATDGERWRRAHAARQLELQWAARTLLTSRRVHDAAIAADDEAAAALRAARRRPCQRARSQRPFSRGAADPRTPARLTTSRPRGLRPGGGRLCQRPRVAW